jgi:hypothetical protein
LALVMALSARVETQSSFAETLVRAGAAATAAAVITDAPSGFDAASNGFAEEYCARQKHLTNTDSSPGVDDDECSFDDAAAEFGAHETEADGIGPVFNAAGCGECHIAPALGGGSQIAERRAGFFDGTRFIDHPGGSLIHDRSTTLSLLETVIESKTNVFTFRGSQSVYGDGYVEAIGNTTLQQIAAAQPTGMRGQIINVPVFEAPGQTRIGRFGWKAQQASLLSFSADAYLNEMGITSPMLPKENSSNGNEVPDDGIVDDEGGDVELFALFHALAENATALRRAGEHAGRDRRQRAVQSGRVQRLPYAHDGDSGTRDPDQRRRDARLAHPSATNGSSRSATSCCTTSTPATASCRTAARPLATRCARRPCGVCIPALALCTTSSATASTTPSSGTATRPKARDVRSTVSTGPTSGG